MTKLEVKEKEIVVPGEVLATGMDFLPAGGSFREGDKIIASHVGLATVDNRLIKVVPLTGKYMPKRNDIIIGKIRDMTFSGWIIDINSAYSAALNSKDATSEFVARGSDLSRFYDFGDVIVAGITNVTKSNMVDLTMRGPEFKKLKDGKIITITASKVPRVIGKQGSMITMIKEMTDCKIIVGQNGVVWISGTDAEKELIATESIIKIENESHTDGLTDKIKKFLEGRLKKK